jgi:RNA polymerase sigma-70 factor (ECF subfamily)
MRPMQQINEKRARLAELMVAVSQGKECAFTEMYEMTHAYLYNVACRIVGSPHHAEEVLQEAYMSVWQQAHRYQPHLGTAMTWLITVVRNQAVSTLRGQGMERQSVSLDQHEWEFDEPVVEGEVPDVIEQAFYASAQARLPAAMARLEPAQRQAITLTYSHGMPHAELAVHLKAPLGTVKSWVRRGMVHLSRYLSEHDSDPFHNRLVPSSNRPRADMRF